MDRQLVERSVSELVPYAKNPRTHSEAQIEQIAASIRAFGFTNPILVDGNEIIAGHGRVRAAVKAGLDSVPCRDLTGLTPDEKRAYVIADNQLALNAGWDSALLAEELEALRVDDFDLSVIGFDAAELADIFNENNDDDAYSRRIAAPTYQPSESQPELAELFDVSRSRELAAQILSANVSDAERHFLLLAAERHTVFDFRKIADYYSHASPEMQDLMERSALVIIDFAKAIELGYVELTERIIGQYAEDYPGAEEDDDA